MSRTIYVIEHFHRNNLKTEFNGLLVLSIRTIEIVFFFVRSTQKDIAFFFGGVNSIKFTILIHSEIVFSNLNL